MKKSELKEIIKEELQNLNEASGDYVNQLDDNFNDALVYLGKSLKDFKQSNPDLDKSELKKATTELSKYLTAIVVRYLK